MPLLITNDEQNASWKCDFLSMAVDTRHKKGTSDADTINEEYRNVWRARIFRDMDNLRAIEQIDNEVDVFDYVFVDFNGGGVIDIGANWAGMSRWRLMGEHLQPIEARGSKFMRQYRELGSVMLDDNSAEEWADLDWTTAPADFVPLQIQAESVEDLFAGRYMIDDFERRIEIKNKQGTTDDKLYRYTVNFDMIRQVHHIRGINKLNKGLYKLDRLDARFNGGATVRLDPSTGFTEFKMMGWEIQAVGPEGGGLAEVRFSMIAKDAWSALDWNDA